MSYKTINTNTLKKSNSSNSQKYNLEVYGSSNLNVYYVPNSIPIVKTIEVSEVLNKHDAVLNKHDAVLNTPDEKKSSKKKSSKKKSSKKKQTGGKPSKKKLIKKKKDKLDEGKKEKKKPTAVKPSKKSDIKHILNFIMRIINSQLWKYKEASDEFTLYIQMLVLNESKNYNDWLNSSFYTPIRERYVELINKYNISLANDNRGVNRVRSIEKYLKFEKITLTVTNYLDIGCYDGEITEAMSEHFKLSKLHAYGVDIKNYIDDSKKESKITFKEYDGKILPFDDSSLDLITCLMVFHHITDENLNILVGEIFRVLKPGGSVILREHDVTDNIDKVGLDIMHYFYDYVWNARGTDANNWISNYKSNILWSELFAKHNLFAKNKLVESGVLQINNKYNTKVNPFFTYLNVFVK